MSVKFSELHCKEALSIIKSEIVGRIFIVTHIFTIIT